jgi:hypothetical protein
MVVRVCDDSQPERLSVRSLRAKVKKSLEWRTLWRLSLCETLLISGVFAFEPQDGITEAQAVPLAQQMTDLLSHLMYIPANAAVLALTARGSIDRGGRTTPRSGGKVSQRSETSGEGIRAPGPRSGEVAIDHATIAYGLTWVGTGTWVICFWWMHRMSARRLAHGAPGAGADAA